MHRPYKGALRVRAMHAAFPVGTPPAWDDAPIEAPGTFRCGTLPGREVLSKSHISSGNLERRLRIEATYPL